MLRTANLFIHDQAIRQQEEVEEDPKVKVKEEHRQNTLQNYD